MGRVEPVERARTAGAQARVVGQSAVASIRRSASERLAELIRTPKREYAAFEAGLALAGGLAPDQVASLLDERVVRLRVELASVEESERIAQEMGIPEVFIVEAAYRLALLRAELSFTSELRDKIRGGTLGGLAGWRRVHELLDGGMSMEEIFRDPTKHLGEDGRVFLPQGPPSG